MSSVQKVPSLRVQPRAKALKAPRGQVSNKFQVKVPSEGSEGSEVLSEDSVSIVQRVSSQGSK